VNRFKRQKLAETERISSITHQVYQAMQAKINLGIV
jgi:hypothetical protein